MNITENKNENVTILKVEGKLDSNTSKNFEEKLQEIIDKKEEKLLLDFSYMDYISSAGLRVLLSTVKKMKAINGKLAIANSNENVQKVIDISGFASIIPYFPALEEANDYLNEQKKNLE